ncbi:pyridoxamine 5'-phosphate oxidase family protein [Micromonospora sp. NBC_01796]|uniref:pyridoxamine 5'-phosphate oxidase family protein n=1 Tax=Micromonospora sp. NBC_01796 TaxID=2975987 RepID=UPI002DD9C521|nr:pyridoxamine 5'-phosphate oxidase family protein [Micromonospora sp. NBC_01796]WSA83709.1 pyridoxamine 5'-phosphate oxidase family protein [Micromonospora sp. NBC_01796]
MTYDLEIAGGAVSATDVRVAVEEILAEARLITLATAGPRGPHASPVFFAADDLTLYFVGERTTRHTGGLATDDRISGAVFVEPPVYGEQLRGVQLHGSAAEVRPEHRSTALSIYRRRFTDFAPTREAQQTFLLGEGRAGLYRFVVDDLTLLDEPRFGRRNYLQANVVR